MKSLLIHNFTKRNLHLVAAFMQKHGMYNIHAIVEPDAFTDEVRRLCVRFGLNVILPLDGIEKTHNSVEQVEKRNPGFEQRVAEFPRHKIEILRRSTQNLDTDNLIGLAINWADHENPDAADLVGIRVRALRSNHQFDSFGEEMHQIFVFQEQNGDLAEKMKFIWGEELSEHFQMVDFGLLMDLGLAGESECLVMTR